MGRFRGSHRRQCGEPHRLSRSSPRVRGGYGPEPVSALRTGAVLEAVQPHPQLGLGLGVRRVAGDVAQLVGVALAVVELHVAGLAALAATAAVGHLLRTERAPMHAEEAAPDRLAA